MNLKQYADENNMTIAEAKEATGLNHWNHTVPEEIEPIVVEKEMPPLEPIKEKPVDKKDLTIEANFSIFILGNKSPHWSK